MKFYNFDGRVTIERPGFESRHIQKRLFFHRNISNYLKIYEIFFGNSVQIKFINNSARYVALCHV